MSLSVHTLQTIWIVLNLTTFLLTLSALVDARADQAAVRSLNGKARELAAGAIVRRESFRLIVQTLFLALVIPGIFVRSAEERPYFMVILMAAAVVLLVSSLLDARDRRAMTILVTAEVFSHSSDALARIEDKLDENTRISQEASAQVSELRDAASSPEPDDEVGH